MNSETLRNLTEALIAKAKKSAAGQTPGGLERSTPKIKVIAPLRSQVQ
jgi:hypothetical protein